MISDLLDAIKSNEATSEQVADVRSYLLDGNEEERSNITIELTRRRIPHFNHIIEENMFSDESAGVRAASFWALAIQADKSKIDVLLEALEMEENLDARLSEIDSFMIFAERHNISADAIQITPAKISKGVVQTSLLHSEHASTSSWVDIPRYQEDILSEGQDDQEPKVESEIIDRSKEADEFPERDIQILKAKTNVKQVLLEITPNVPISLNRIAEVNGVTTRSLEKYLTELTEFNPQAGSYFPLEQVFIKKIETVRQVLDRSPIVDKTCMSCGAVAKRYPCETCGEGTQCITCKLNIGTGEDTLHCIYCKNPSHSKHLLEWLKIKGECPHCKEKLSSEEL